MNDTLHDDIAYLLLDFTLERQAFSLQDLGAYTNSNSSMNMLETALGNDPRFIRLTDSSAEPKQYVTGQMLCSHFVRLTISLACKRRARLSEAEFASFMNHMRRDGGHWTTPPREAVDFGQKLGFVSPAWAAGEYVFPLAHVLGLISRTRISMADIFLRAFAAHSAGIPSADLPARLIEDELRCYDANISYVIKHREGLLTSKKLTLEKIGSHLEVTRERVRQIESKFWKIVKRLRSGQPFVDALVYDIMARKGSLIVKPNTPDARLRQFIAKCLNIPYATFPNADVCVIGARPEDVAMFKPARWFGIVSDAQHVAQRLDSSGKLVLIADDIRTIALGIMSSLQKKLQRGEKVALALRAIGRPAHFTEITQAYNSMFPDEPSSEHNVHAILGREKHGVVWIGVRGTFALAEWGYEHPPQTLFDTVTDIVTANYAITGQPVPFQLIIAEIGKYRKITRPASLTIAAHCNPALRRVSNNSFVPASSTRDKGEQASAEELDRILREFESGKVP